MVEYFKRVWNENERVRKIIGWILIVVGIISIITPLTPGGFLLPLGLGILGVRLVGWEKVRDWFRK